MAEIEKNALEKINAMWNLVADCTNDADAETLVSQRIQDYFLNQEPSSSISDSGPHNMDDKSSRLIRLDIKMLVTSQEDAIKTPRQVARIFHGISSPQFPAAVWCKNGLWAKRRHVDFNFIMKIARNVFVDAKLLPRLPAAPPSSLPPPPPPARTEPLPVESASSQSESESQSSHQVPVPDLDPNQNKKKTAASAAGVVEATPPRSPTRRSAAAGSTK